MRDKIAFAVRLLALMVAFCAATGLTAKADPSDFTIVDGVLTAYNGGGGDVVIPNGVTSIGDSAFFVCSDLTSITIPDSVTSIGNGAFYYCIGLTSVTIGNGVTSIGPYAFCGCGGLTNVTIPNSVTSIGDYAFYICSGLTSVIFMAATPPTGIDGILSATSAKVWYPIKSADLYRQVVPDLRFGGYLYLTLGDYVGVFNGVLSSEGEHPWQVDPDICHDGSGSICSGTITHNEKSCVEMTVSGAGLLSFWWKASSEYDGDCVFDYCYLSIDDEPKGRVKTENEEYALEGIAIGGASDWQKVVVNIEGDGLHTVRWTYIKDDVDEGYIGEDCAWLDEVEFAEWISVSFNIGEGVGSAPEVISELRGTIITLPAQAGFNRADYTFVG